MEIFPPANLPGVGMGNLVTIVGVGGLVGLATSSGAMLASGLSGIVLYCAAAFAVLSQKSTWLGGQPELVWGLLALLLVLGVARTVLDRRRAEGVEAPRAVQLLDMLAVLVGGAAVGFAWAEWNEAPFALADTEAVVGLLVGAACAALGGDAAHLFLRGSIKAGGHPAIIVTAVLVAAAALNALGMYVPFVGFAAIAVAAVFAVRLRRTSQKKYRGLRILS